MIRPNLCDHNDSYILVKETVTVPKTSAAGATVKELIKK